jgi:hypothetical protein
MDPAVRDGDVVTVAPLKGQSVRVGRIVAFRGGEGRLVLHRVVRRLVASRGEVLLETRGDNCPAGDGLVELDKVIGVVTAVERHGRPVIAGIGMGGVALARLSRHGALQPAVAAARAARRRALPRRTTPPVLPLETVAVLRCAQAVIDEQRLPAFREAIAACPSAEALCREAVRQGMLGHLHRLIHAQPDTSFASFVLGRLNELHLQAAQRALAQTAHLLRLVDYLGEHGVTAMPIKGPVWGERLYGDLTLRHWQDLDIIVPFDQASAAHALLLQAGYRCESEFAERFLMRPARGLGELLYSNTRDGVLVDLQWHLGVGHTTAALTGATLAARAEALSLLGHTIPMSSTSDMLVLSCLHGGRHRWDRIELLLGLAVQVRSMPAEDWPALLETARDAGHLRRVVIAVAHACHVFSLPVPTEVTSVLAKDPMARAFVASLGPDTLLERLHGDRRQHVALLLWMLATEDSLASCLAHTAVRAVSPGPSEWSLVSLPSWGEWLYWPMRPLRLAVAWTSAVRI